MEKLTISSQDLERASISQTGSGVTELSEPMPLPVRLALVLLAVALPALCVATIAVWLFSRAKPPPVKSARIGFCCALLVASGLLTSAGMTLFLLLDQRAPEPVATEMASLPDLLDAFHPIPPDTTLTPKELAAARESMVFIVARDEWPHPNLKTIAASGFGSGVLIFADESNYLIATNRHVLDGDDWQDSRRYQGRVVLGMRAGGFGRADIVGRRKALDLMLLQAVRHKGRIPFAQAVQEYSKIETGEQIVTFGHPQGLFFTMANGLVSRLDGKNIVQISAPVSPGSSGGPVFDLHGRLLGVVTAMWSKNAGPAENLNFALRADAFLKQDDWNVTPSGTQAFEKFISASEATRPPASSP
jgi:S1-C subfamily serine protease